MQKTTATIATGDVREGRPMIVWDTFLNAVVDIVEIVIAVVFIARAGVLEPDVDERGISPPYL